MEEPLGGLGSWCGVRMGCAMVVGIGKCGW